MVWGGNRKLWYNMACFNMLLSFFSVVCWCVTIVRHIKNCYQTLMHIQPSACVIVVSSLWRVRRIAHLRPLPCLELYWPLRPKYQTLYNLSPHLHNFLPVLCRRWSRMSPSSMFLLYQHPDTPCYWNCWLANAVIVQAWTCCKVLLLNRCCRFDDNNLYLYKTIRPVNLFH